MRARVGWWAPKHLGQHVIFARGHQHLSSFLILGDQQREQGPCPLWAQQQQWLLKTSQARKAFWPHSGLHLGARAWCQCDAAGAGFSHPIWLEHSGFLSWPIAQQLKPSCAEVKWNQRVLGLETWPRVLTQPRHHACATQGHDICYNTSRLLELTEWQAHLSDWAHGRTTDKHLSGRKAFEIHLLAKVWKSPLELKDMFTC